MNADPISVGLIGVGPWGRKLATAFAVNGFPITEYARNSRSPGVTGLGKRWMDWRDLINNSSMVICAATPAVTYEVYRECLSRHKPALLTKPLYVTDLPDETMSAPVMIDYVRLWSPNYEMLKKRAELSKVTSININFCGDGPVRDFPGLYDYGPHVFAWVFDLLSTQTSYASSFEMNRVEVDAQSDSRKKIYIVSGYIDSVAVTARFGNGLSLKTTKDRQMLVRFKPSKDWKEAEPPWGFYDETPDVIRTEVCGVDSNISMLSTINSQTPTATSPLGLMVQSFISCSGYGKKNRPRAEMRTLALSTKIHRTLKSIHEAEESMRKEP